MLRRVEPYVAYGYVFSYSIELLVFILLYFCCENTQFKYIILMHLLQSVLVK
jgi:hypothetical protein